MLNHSEVVSFIWSVADLIRDTFKRGKYQDVILPFTVLRRIDSVLEPTKDKVFEKYEQLKKGDIKDMYKMLSKTSGFAFYNVSKYNFKRLVEDSDPSQLPKNLKNYIHGFSENMQKVLEKFEFEKTITKLHEEDLLLKVLQKFKAIDLSMEAVPNNMMGTIFEELIRKFNEALDENPGEHFTPPEVVSLMSSLVIEPDRDTIKKQTRAIALYDGCSGTGRMLVIGKERIQKINPDSQVFLFGQEVNPETWAICKSDLYIKYPKSEDAENIVLGSTLSNDLHAGKKFDYMLENPPYGKDWNRDKTQVEQEAGKGFSGRFGAGLPRISDGQLLFLQNMIFHMRDPKEGGSRIAIIMNGSPLFTGDAGSGESEIRRWILENDLLEAIVAMPEQLFYNTGISTYIWVLTNRKDDKRKGKVQLIDASSFWIPMRKSLGNKRREITPEQIESILKIFLKFSNSENSKIFKSTDFGFRKVTIERPLRLIFHASNERIELVQSQAAFTKLVEVKDGTEKKKKEKLIEEGKVLQNSILKFLDTLPKKVFKDRNEFDKAFQKEKVNSKIDLTPQMTKAIYSALSERDETAEICKDKNGNLEADSDLRDTESIPLAMDVKEYFETEVKPHVPDAWINESIVDDKDGKVGRVGYEINFNRYFYKYEAPRKLEEIESEIKSLLKEIEKETDGILL